MWRQFFLNCSLFLGLFTGELSNMGADAASVTYEDAAIDMKPTCEST
jgi:hypothetical protein